MLIPPTQSRVQICLDNDLLVDLDRLAKERRVPRSHLIQCATRTFLYAEIICRRGEKRPLLDLAPAIEAATRQHAGAQP